MIGINENDCKVLKYKLEIKYMSGTLKVCKTFLIFKDSFTDYNLTWFLHEAIPLTFIWH